MAGCGAGMITVQHKKIVNALGTPRVQKLFKPNEQYCYTGTVSRTEGCGCGGTKVTTTKYFIVTVDGRQYEVPETDAFVSNVEIAADAQDFELLYRTQIFQGKEHQDYSQINNNCTNCNQDIAHGDYNNNINTGGLKDPQLTGKI